MSDVIAAAIFVLIELLLARAYFASGRRIAREREAAGSTKPITMASSFWLVLWFLYHCPLVVVLAPSPKTDRRVKVVLGVLINAGTPALYFCIFFFTGRHGLRWHQF